MRTDTLININDTIRKLELIYPDLPKKSLFGLPIELASILIPVIITISIFGLGIFIQWRQNKKNRILKLSSIKTLIIEWSNLTENTIKLQHNLYQLFRNNLEAQQDLQPISISQEPFLIDKIDSLDLRELIELVIVNHDGNKNENAAILLNIVAGIHKLSNIEKSAIKKYDEFLDYTYKLGDEWNSKYKLLDEYLASLPYKISNSKNEFEKEYFQSFAKIFGNINEQSKKIGNNTQLTITHLIIPLKDLCTKFIIKDSSFTEVYSIDTTLKELLLIWTKWMGYKNGINRYFKEIENITFESYKYLKNNIEILEKMKLKKWYKIK